MASRKEILNRHQFPMAPIRHKDAMDKLARCRFCDRLCCCLEHLVEHENRHSNKKGTKQAIYEKKGSSSESSKWVEATEHVLHSNRGKINYPLVCVYCKITVRNEHELRHLMTVGPRCSSKVTHWIISFKKYREKARDRNILLVLEETKKNPANSDISVRYTNFSVNHFTHPHVTPRENSSLSLRRMKPISTSTPQEECDSSTLGKDISSPAVEQTPVGAKSANAPQSILAVKNDHKPKGESSRKVTFSCIVETTIDSSIEERDSDNLEINEEEIHNNKNDSGSKFGESYYADKNNQFKDGEKSEQFIFHNKDGDQLFLSEKAEQNMCDSEVKVEHENKENVVEGGIENQLKIPHEHLEYLNEMGIVEGYKAVKELEGETVEDAGCELENEKHGQLGEPKTNNVIALNNDRAEDKIESLAKEEEHTSECRHEEIVSQNNSLDESEESLSQSMFFSGEESGNETNAFKNESSGTSEKFEDSSGYNTGPTPRKDVLQSPDSQNLQMLSNQFSAGQEFTNNSKFHVQVNTNDNSESEPLLIVNELQLDAQAYVGEDSEPSSSNYGDAINFPFSEGNVSSDDDRRSESNIDQEWGLTKLKAALSYSWDKAKELVMHPWGTKRNNIDCSEEENNENCPKRIKMSHSCSPSDCNSSSSFPVHWKCSQRPIRSSEYFNISKRRPLSRMMKK